MLGQTLSHYEIVEKLGSDIVRSGILYVPTRDSKKSCRNSPSDAR